MIDLDGQMETNLQSLLKQIALLIQNQRESEKLKGESFNVFSILKLESNENRTHSAFLAELLNPKGSHLMGSVFLEHFLSIIGLQPDYLDTTETFVKLEHSVGVRNLDDMTGGRIDIFISDKKKHLSIENKIYASDQDGQIERYCNYEKGRNHVIYLTLYGSSPTEMSKGSLQEDLDFFPVSYKKHILEWLELCAKDAYGAPILRETIRQYQILLKKLTNSMDSSDNKRLVKAILEHYFEAETVAKNFENMRIDLANMSRLKICRLLKNKLGDEFLIKEGHPVRNQFSQIWIHPADLKSKDLWFGLESFSIHNPKDKPYFIGIFNSKRRSSDEFDSQIFNFHNSNWFNVKEIGAFKGCVVNNQDPRTLLKLHEDERFNEDFFQHLLGEVVDYLTVQAPRLVDFYKRSSE